MQDMLEKLLFHSRWLLAPMYLGLVGALLIIVYMFGLELVHIVTGIASFGHEEVVLALLTLVDITLVGNLILLVVFSGYENFVSKIDSAKDSTDRPSWMGKVGYSDLKLKMISSIVAISAIELLKSFMHVESMDDRTLTWMIGLHATLVMSGLLFALTDWLAARTKH